MAVPPIVGAGLGAAQLLGGKKSQNKAQGAANRLTQEQLAQIHAAFPLIQQGEQNALQFDPTAQSAQAMNAFDEAANQSAKADFGNAQLPLSLRGFSAGNASTESSGALQSVAAQRSANRGALAASLKEGEYGKKQAALSSALQPAFMGAQALSGPQAGYANQANGWDPTGPLSLLGSGLNGIFKRRNPFSAFPGPYAPSDIGGLPTIGQ